MSRVGIPFLFLLWLAACIDSDRLNTSCQWSDAHSRPLDLHNAADRNHLREDALIAEALGIRLGDSFRGVKTITERRALWTACTDSLFGVIARSHSVARDDVRVAPHERNLLIDLVLVFVPMVVLLWFVATIAADRVRHRFLPDEPILALLFTLLAAFAVSGLWWLVGEMWGWIVEMLRLHDDHISYRAGRLPWYRFGVPLFAFGLAVFCWRAWRGWRGTSRVAV